MEPVDFDLDELFGPATAREEDNLQGAESNLEGSLPQDQVQEDQDEPQDTVEEIVRPQQEADDEPQAQGANEDTIVVEIQPEDSPEVIAVPAGGRNGP